MNSENKKGRGFSFSSGLNDSDNQFAQLTDDNDKSTHSILFILFCFHRFFNLIVSNTSSVNIPLNNKRFHAFTHHAHDIATGAWQRGSRQDKPLPGDYHVFHDPNPMAR